MVDYLCVSGAAGPDDVHIHVYHMRYCVDCYANSDAGGVIMNKHPNTVMDDLRVKAKVYEHLEKVYSDLFIELGDYSDENLKPLKGSESDYYAIVKIMDVIANYKP